MSAYPRRPDLAPSAATLRRISTQTIYTLFGLIIGGVIWLFGANYTVNGTVAGANGVLALLSFPHTIPAPAWQWWHYLLWALPVLCSIVEWCPPWSGDRNQRTFSAICIWLFLATIDLTTTFLGIGLPEDVAGYQIAFVCFATAFLTFFPEWIIKSSLQSLVQVFRR